MAGGIATSTSGGFANERVVTQTLTTGTTYMVSLTYDNSNIRVYVNGAIIGTALAQTGTHAAITEGAVIAGYGSTSTVDFFDGTIDEVSTFTRGLSAAELLALYNSGTSAAASTAVGNRMRRWQY